MATISDLHAPSALRLPLGRASLFLDLDGTLVEFGDDPATIRASSAVQCALARCQASLCGRLAILSGRSIASVDEVLGGGVVAVAGVHGLQQRSAVLGVMETPPHPGIAEVMGTLEVIAKADRRLRIEPKGQSVAIHFRQAPAAEPAIVEIVERLAKGAHLEVQYGVMVAELRTPGPDKGAALESLMALPPFAGSKPIFVGDDLTDESGFVMAQALGGVGIAVGPRAETAARGRLSNPAAVLSWLNRSLDTGVFDVADS